LFFVGGGEEGAEFWRLKLDGVHGSEEAAVEVVHAGVASGAGGVGSFIWRKRPPMRCKSWRL